MLVAKCLIVCMNDAGSMLFEIGIYMVKCVSKKLNRVREPVVFRLAKQVEYSEIIKVAALQYIGTIFIFHPRKPFSFDFRLYIKSNVV